MNPHLLRCACAQLLPHHLPELERCTVYSVGYKMGREWEVNEHPMPTLLRGLTSQVDLYGIRLQCPALCLI